MSLFVDKYHKTTRNVPK